MANRLAPWLIVATLGCPGADHAADTTTTTGGTTTGDVAPVSYAACEDPLEGCAEVDCRRRDDAAGAWSVCVPPCTEDADCPSGAPGNTPIVCDPEGRCVLECVPQVLTCPSGTTCIDGNVAQCMWPSQ